MAHKLLLADDSVTIQRVIELTFADEDIEVSAVGDGQQAIERIRADRPDIVLADVGMPERDGFEVAAFVKQDPDLCHIPVLLLTGAFEPVDNDRVQAVGCDGVLAKPFEPQLLIAKVKELLASRAQDKSVRVPVPTVATPNPVEDLAFEEIPLKIPSTSDLGSGLDAGLAASEPDSKVSLDEYFDRLDQAFANRAVMVPTPPPNRPPLTPAADEGWPSQSGFDPGWVNESSVAVPEPNPPVLQPQMIAAAIQEPQAEAAPDLAAAFALLLAAEQGEAIPAGALPLAAGAHSAAFETIVDEVTKRVIERLADGSVRHQVAETVSRIAERLVRAEIERLKALS